MDLFGRSSLELPTNLRQIEAKDSTWGSLVAWLNSQGAYIHRSLRSPCASVKS